MQASLDFGITNLDVAFRKGAEIIHTRLPAGGRPVLNLLEEGLEYLRGQGVMARTVAVTGGKYRSLPDEAGDLRLVKVPEVSAIGLGGLYLAGLSEALVVSAGSGTAMVAARGAITSHVTGSAVGGGTLQGLGRLLLGTADAQEIDRLALQGDPNRADLTLVEAVGGAVGKLPLDANAVNFGRVARQAVDLAPEDTAAALVRLVAQVIAVVAINAARAEGLSVVVVTGHLVDLGSVRKVLEEVAGYYGADIRVPQRPGAGTAIGALLALEKLG